MPAQYRKEVVLTNKIRQLKRKKGFTLIELIVVLAIIGVLLAIIIPVFMSSDKPASGKSYAKDYYYRVQNFMSHKKLAEDPASPVLSGDTAFVIRLNKGMVSISDADCTVSKWSTSASAWGARETVGSISDSGLDTLAKAFVNAMNGDLMSADFDGWLYAVVDKEYRVTSAYWSDGAWNDVVGRTFNDNCRVGDYYACSYPVNRCMPTGSSTLKMLE